MRHKTIYSFLAMFFAIAISSCRDDDGTFTNKVFTTSDRIQTILMKQNVTDAEGEIQVRISQLEDQDVVVNYQADATQVGDYNLAFADSAIMLPAGHFQLTETSVTIPSGSVSSKSLSVKFNKIEELDHNKRYVLPVRIASANISILERSRNTYFVFQGAALINVVANIEQNYLTVGTSWTKPEVVNNLTTLTMEALIRARDFNRLISSVMGIEGHFLIRIGDAGFPAGQIQLASGRGNFPGPDQSKVLPLNQWVHVAVTYNATTQNVRIYVNGKVQSEGTQDLGSAINLGTSDFFIGRSYDDNRYLAGDVAECRIWNVVRTPEEIAANPYYVDPASLGLVAYWKCNEGSGNKVLDNSGNGNDLTAKNNLIWTPVELPESKK